MYIHQHRVRFNEVDAQGVVFNSHYLTWCDHAIYEFFRLNGWSPSQLKKANIDLVVRTANLDYVAPALLDQILTFNLYVTKVGKSSFSCKFLISHEQALLVTVTITYVNVPEDSAVAFPPFALELLNQRLEKQLN